MAKQVMMKLKVNLECHKCYKKVKKVLCKFPEIRDQVYDEKQNIVTIRVVSCNPEKIRDKLCCKGGGSIKSIDIVEPSKPKPAPETKKEEPKKDKPVSKPQTPRPEPDPVPPPTFPTVRPAAMFPEPASVSVMAYPPPVMAIPITMNYEGHAGYGGYCGRPINDSYGGGGRPADMYRNNPYWREDNASWCTIV